MLFSSNIFLYTFLPLVFCLYFLLPSTKLKNFFLLISSFTFYYWSEGKYTLILLLSVLIAWIFGILIKNIPKYSKIFLSIGVTLSLGILGYFKYFTFFQSNFTGSSTPSSNIHLPIGISFFTFQVISYLVDIYRQKINPQKNILKLSLYKSFFPQLIAGPIIRYIDIYSQIEKRTHSISKVFDGLWRFSLGLSKKVIIANSIGIFVDNIFSLPANNIGFLLSWLGAIGYAFQIYFDFSGYSDMAIGLGKVFGFSIKENFNHPYTATSITDFWTKWHISLSSWFKDYLYIPLGGNRCSKIRNYFNLFIVFVLCGFWHGASWNFVLWGIYFAILLMIEKYFNIPKSKFPNIFKIFTTFVLVDLSWVIFRSNSVHSAFIYFKSMFFLNNINPINGININQYLNINFVFYLIVAIYFSFIHHQIFKKTLPVILRGIIMLFLLLLSLIYISENTYNPFIYFRF